ncbi:MAG: APC family permease [Rhodococcus sp. (in: high G+C Gram-positive bacteria)]
MSSISPAPSPSGTLTAPRIALLVISAAAPLACVVGTIPLALALGGPSTTAMFIVVGCILALFTVGYAVMSRKIAEPGGFYPYITAAMGRILGCSAAWLALLGYTAASIAAAAVSGYYGNLVLEQQLGIDVPWFVYSLALLVVVGALATRQIDLGAKVVGIAVTCEFVVILIVGIAVVAREGIHGLPSEVFAPHVAFSTGFPIALMYALTCFIGFESGALYAPEARDPKRSVALATYAAVTVMTLLLAFMSWVFTGAYGINEVQGVAGQELGDLMFTLSTAYTSPWVTTLLAFMMLLSQFACMVTLTNAAARYIQALGAKRILPPALGAVHARFGSPVRAAILVVGVTLGALIVFGLALGLNPFTDITSVAFGIGALSIVTLQAAASLSAVLFFRRSPERHWWRTMVAPGLGAAGLIISIVLMVRDFDLVTGNPSTVVGLMPLLLVVATCGGALYGVYLRRTAPRSYANLKFVLPELSEPFLATSPDSPVPTGPNTGSDL